MNLPFGTIYAFSVFLGSLEAALGVGRAELSAVFALATISLTVGMLVAPRLYAWIAPAPLALACGLTSAAGLALASGAHGLPAFALGYGVLFGLGAGVGFILVQQGVNQTLRAASGLANGYVVSLYPLGAMIGAPAFGWAIDAYGIRATLAGLGMVVVLTSMVSAILLARASVQMLDATPGAGRVADPRRPVFWRLSAVFFLAAAAGLMVMSQAAGIIRTYGAGTALALGATTAITGAIAAARLGGGWLYDRRSMPWVGTFAHLVSLAGAALLTLWPGPLVAVPGLAMIGMGYGFISGSTAGAIAQYWGRNAFGLVAGRVYVAWCVAAVTLPVLAGWLYDRTHVYSTAVLIAAAGNLLGAWLASGLPGREPPARPEG